MKTKIVIIKTIDLRNVELLSKQEEKPAVNVSTTSNNLLKKKTNDRDYSNNHELERILNKRKARKSFDGTNNNNNTTKRNQVVINNTIDNNQDRTNELWYKMTATVKESGSSYRNTPNKNV